MRSPTHILHSTRNPKFYLLSVVHRISDCHLMLCKGNFNKEAPKCERASKKKKEDVELGSLGG